MKNNIENYYYSIPYNNEFFILNIKHSNTVQGFIKHYNKNILKVFRQPGIESKNHDDKSEYLLSLAQNSSKDFDIILKCLGKLTNAIKVLSSSEIGLKNNETILNKGKTLGDINNVTDILRGSLIYENLDDLKSSLKVILLNTFTINIKNRLNYKYINDISINIINYFGLIAEIHLLVKETFDRREPGIILPENLFVDFTTQDYEIMEELKELLLDKNSIIPKNGELIKGHLIYELYRILNSPEYKSNCYINLLKKINELRFNINLYSKHLYTQRTGKLWE